MPNNRLISMLIGLGMLGACSDGDERGRTAGNDNGAQAENGADGGGDGSTRVSINLPGIEGKFNLPSLKIGASDVDIGGVKLYPGTRVTGLDVAGEDGRGDGGVTIRFDAEAAPTVLRDYYLDAFKDRGLTASADGSGVTGRDSEGKPFRIELKAQNGGTRGTIHMGNAPG